MSKHVLQARAVAVSALEVAVIEQAWQLFDGCYAAADRSRFETDLAAKDKVLLLIDTDGQLQGFSTLQLRRHGEAMVAFSGDTVIAPHCWGQPALPLAFAAEMAAIKLNNPERPLYWLLISKGFRTYRMLARAFERAWPNCDGRHQDLQPLLNRLATDRFGDQFDATTGIIRYREQHEYVRTALAVVPPTRQSDAVVQFFLHSNPGHHHGDELACLAEIRLSDPIIAMAARRLRRDQVVTA